MRLPSLFQFRVLKTALASIFGKAFTDPFPAKPYEPIKQFRGRPRYHEEDCIGCGACAEVCPSGCIKLTEHREGGRPVRRLTHQLDLCIACGQCQRYCTTEKGILLTNEWDFVGFSHDDFFEKIEKELLLCEACGKVLAPADQIRWLVARLGQLAFCNPTLMLVSHRELGLLDKGSEPDSAFPERARRVSIQCPHCRRKTAFTA